MAASFEDFGLSPIEAAAFGKPTAALHAGGYLDTIDPGVSGLFFAEPAADDIATAMETLTTKQWDEQAIRDHAERFSEERFIQRLREIAFGSQSTRRPGAAS
jgi:glycosyltransferase involved in cell wall biosynthesis